SGMVEQRMYGLDHRIVHIRADRISRKADLRRLRLAAQSIVPGDDAGRNSDGRRARGHIAHDDGVGADPGAIANEDRPQHLGPGTDYYLSSERRMTLDLFPLDAAKRDAVIQRAVIADLRGFADDHAHSVVDEDAAADRRPGMDFDPCEPSPPVGQPARKPAEAGSPQGMRHPAMPSQGVQSRVAS